MNGKKSLTRPRQLRDRVTAVVASAGAIALTAGFMMMAAAGPANADKGGKPNANSNGNGSQSSQSDDGPGKSEDSNGKGNKGDKGNANSNGNGNGKNDDKKTDVCHATSSMTNPYVFINVSVNAVKKNGHRMHRDFPNKSWSEAADWNGMSFEAGDARPDYIALLDGAFTEAWCEAAPTAPQPPDGPGPAVVPPAGPPPDIAGTEEPAPKPDKKPEVKGTEAVPTAVAAGIGGNGPTMTGSSPIDLLAQMLVGGGLALLMGAGWMQIGRRANGVHQA